MLAATTGTIVNIYGGTFSDNIAGDVSFYVAEIARITARCCYSFLGYPVLIKEVSQEPSIKLTDTLDPLNIELIDACIRLLHKTLETCRR